MLQITRTRTRFLALNVVAVSCLAAATLTATATAQAQVRAERLGLATQQAGNPLLVREADRGEGRLNKANIISSDGTDPRRYFERGGRSAFLSPIGMTLTDGKVPMRGRDGEIKQSVGRGTGFMISPCTMLTNYHTVFGTASSEPSEEIKHYEFFDVGYRAGGGFKLAGLKGQLTSWGSLAFLGGVGYDWALVSFNECPGADPDVGWLEINRDESLDLHGLKVAVFGYPGDRDVNRITGHVDCQILGEDEQGQLEHNCAVTPGNSGSPMIAFIGGKPIVVAMVFGSPKGYDGIVSVTQNQNREYRNIAIDVRIISDEVRLLDFIDKGIAFAKKQFRLTSNPAYSALETPAR